MRCFKIANAILKHPAKRGRRLRRLRSRSYSPRKPKACRVAAGGIANNCIVCNSGQYNSNKSLYANIIFGSQTEYLTIL